jgi:hypothetical protein
MRGCNDLASARLVVYAKIFVASTGGFEEFACRMRMQKRVVQKSQNWLSAFFYLPFFPSSCGLFSSESICIYYDSSRFALLWVFLFCFVMNGKGILSHHHHGPDCELLALSFCQCPKLSLVAGRANIQDLACLD